MIQKKKKEGLGERRWENRKREKKYYFNKKIGYNRQIDVGIL